MKFKKLYKKSEMPTENARTFENGDICLMSPYVKGSPEPLFHYYRPTPKGFKFVRSFWKGRKASQYNWAKVNGKLKPEVKAKVIKKTKKTRGNGGNGAPASAPAAAS